MAINVRQRRDDIQLRKARSYSSDDVLIHSSKLRNVR
jgi:hypothetical protein